MVLCLADARDVRHRIARAVAHRRAAALAARRGVGAHRAATRHLATGNYAFFNS